MTLRNPLASANSRRPFRFQELGQIRCSWLRQGPVSRRLWLSESVSRQPSHHTSKHERKHEEDVHEQGCRDSSSGSVCRIGR